MILCYRAQPLLRAFTVLLYRLHIDATDIFLIFEQHLGSERETQYRPSVL